MIYNNCINPIREYVKGDELSLRGTVAVGYGKYVALAKISDNGNLELVQIFRLVENNSWQKCPTQKLKHQLGKLMREGEKKIKAYRFQELEVIFSLDDDFVKSIRILYNGVPVTPIIRNDAERFTKKI